MALPDREDLLALLREKLPPRRVLHTLGVEDVAFTLAVRWGADAEKARCAAILHDITKEAGDPLQLCKLYGILPEELEDTVPSAYHALTGSALARALGFSEGVASAVRWHTTGRAGMTLLEKIIYLADKTEPFRPLYSGLSEIRREMFVDIDRALAMTLRRIICWNQKKGMAIEKSSAEALEWLEGMSVNGTVKTPLFG